MAAVWADHRFSIWHDRESQVVTRQRQTPVACQIRTIFLYLASAPESASRN
jgi:hypothetical protein